MVRKSINRLVKASIIAGGVALNLTTNYLVLAILNNVAPLFSNEISYNSQTEEVLKKEQKKLGIEDKVIELDLSRIGGTPASTKIGSKYLISLPEFSRDESSLRHELCHIANGDLDYAQEMEQNNDKSNKFLSKFHYFFWEEPRAILYGALGIKI